MYNLKYSIKIKMYNQNETTLSNLRFLHQLDKDKGI